MTISRIVFFKNRPRYWIQRTCSLILTTFLLSACAQPTPYLYEAGEKPFPPGIENQIHPNSTTQDDVLALLGEPVARLKTTTKEGHVHVWTYSYLNLHGPQKGNGESLTITFDNESFVVISVIRGPL
jgi:outer membrane protein assembly factor BamE (lipoprotein component of BamABCDE complex)